MTWIDYIDYDHEDSLALEAWLVGMMPPMATSVVAAWDERMERASYGDIPVADDSRDELVPVRTNPDVYELKQDALSMQIRQYHGEPSALPEHLVKLHMHIKQNKARRDPYDKVQARQQVAIDHAVDRYREGQAESWGAP